MSAEFDALERVLEKRYSCRGFLPDQVPPETIQRILRAAGQVPSWCNAQPWQATVTAGEATDRFRDALKVAVRAGEPAPDMPWPEGYPGVYGDRRRTCGYQLYEAAGIEREDHAGRAAQSFRNFQLFDAPHVAIIHSEAKLGPYGASDCGGFVSAFMLAAASLGVASIAQASVASFPAVIRSHFDLPQNRMVLCAISFGFEDPGHPANGFRTERASLNEVLDLRL